MTNDSKETKEPLKSKYHHGDLRQDLIDAASQMIKEFGVEGLSLRKLAGKVGVSRTAPYHHFKDKNELLCAIAEQGFKDRLSHIEGKYISPADSGALQLKQYMFDYIEFAQHNPELYELMFGRTIWKQQIDNQALKDAAYPSFQHQLEVTKQWQSKGLLDQQTNSLRLSQVIWGTMHGVAKLLIDGIYTHTSQVEEICACAAELFAKRTDA
jgi:AcrR family transcriptional regulator